MLPDSSADVTVRSDGSAAFARLSGDYNPLHLDPVAARRTPFGGTVVHGIHLVLAALDATAGWWSRGDVEPAGISVTFNHPVHTGAPLRILAKAGSDPDKVRLVGELDRRAAFSANVELGPAPHGAACEPDDSECESASPHDLDFPPSVSAGEVPLRLDRRLLHALFPALTQLRGRGWIADLLATTRLVGMECPGARSIYSACKLRRVDQRGSPMMPALRYRIEKTDERFRSIRLAVDGCALSGTIDALFRPAPVAQPSLREIASRVSPDLFNGQRALVVGGSRGLGELTAKIIIAGGGHATITYSRGRADAERVCGEARALEQSCAIERLDVLEDPSPAWLAQPFSHVYYFASPSIAKNATGRWDEALFRRLEAVYVQAFAVLAQAILSHSPRERLPLFVFPSTIFLAQRQSGFAEYVVAKAAGEALCRELASQHDAAFVCPRLPRMRTDQTSGVPDADVQDSFRVMHELLFGLRAPT